MAREFTESFVYGEASYYSRYNMLLMHKHRNMLYALNNHIHPVVADSHKTKTHKAHTLSAVIMESEAPSLE